MSTALTRATRAIAGVAVAASLLALSACSSDDASTSQSEGTDTSASYTVEHAMGTETFESVPERIVVLDSPQLDALVSLGVTPVGATESSQGQGFPGYLKAKLEGTESVGLTQEPDLDAIAALDPDLIIGSKVRHEAIYAELEAIAPTVYSVNSGTDWHEQANITAVALDRADDMTKLLSDLDARAQQVGETVGAEGKTASMVRFRPDNFRLYGPETFSGSILTQVGFDLGDREWNEYSMMELSPEQFEQIDGEIVFYANPGGDPAATTMGTVSGLWGEQPGIKAGNSYEVEDETWMVGIGVTGANLILDQIESDLK